MIGWAAAALARSRNSAYLRPMSRPTPAPNALLRATPPRARASSIIVWSAAAVGALVVLAAAVLWLHYGTAVFYEMIAAGIAACF